MTDTEKIYGDALYDVALECGETAIILAEIKEMCSSFADEPDFIALLAAPSLTKDERCNVIDECFKGKINEHLLNFIKVITENDVVRSFDKCCERFVERYNIDNNIVSVRAVSASEIPDELKTKLSDKVRSITGKEPEITYVLDPNCIGGMLIDIDGTRFDGTIRKRLDDMRRVLTENV